MQNSNKVISIITSTFNSENTILNLINCFELYKPSFVEWIIIDNCSTDQTLEILDNNSSLIDKIVSEKDLGIYDAWNKGLSLSKGEFIGFIGSDDLIDISYFDIALDSIYKFNDYNILAFMINYKSAMGDIMLNDSIYKKPSNFPMNLGFYHPGTLHHKSLFEYEKFDVSFKIAGDQEFLTRRSNIIYPKIVISNYAIITHYSGGASTNTDNKLNLYREVKLIYQGIDISSLTILFHLFWFRIKYIYILFKYSYIEKAFNNNPNI